MKDALEEKDCNELNETESKHFIQEIVEDDIRSGKFQGRIHTRFPPEPNGYLHIGHAKSICLNFGLASKNGGLTNLRFDDTNPVKEDTEYVNSIKEDVRWLGFDWDDREYYASDYFGKLYEYAVKLIEKGKAYVCDLSQDEMALYRGTVNQSGKNSPCRDRSVDENLNLFQQMKNGAFPDGARVLRAKIDMASPNMLLRDPILYRILHIEHHRTGDAWRIYPMYDFAHGQCDSIEKITHSICTLEFEVHRPLYDWLIRELEIYAPQQIEFARLNLTYTMMSKRKLLELVKGGFVRGWDDPRMPTICGLRRRGFTPESLRNFAEKVGVARRDNVIDISLLEFCLREDLNKRAMRVMGIMNPLKVTIINYPENQVEWMCAVNNPEDCTAGSRKVPFSKEIYIERDDFMEDPPKKYFRLSPGSEVRLRYAYFIKCEEVLKDPVTGDVTELRCSYDPASQGGNSPDGRKVKGTIHWVSVNHALQAEVRLYDRLFVKENPEDCDDCDDYKVNINPDSLKMQTCFIEPSVKEAAKLDKFQFERVGYFTVDYDSTPEKLVFNRTVTLKDSWSKIARKE